MPRYTFEIEAGDGFPDHFETDLANSDAAYDYAIELASARLQQQDVGSSSMVVSILIKDEQGELQGTVRSLAD